MLEAAPCSFKGTIGGVKVTLATYYAPNAQQDLFVKNTLDKLLEFAEGQLILGDDLNVPLVPSVDTSSGFSSILPGTCKRISKSLDGAQLVDVWRLLHSGV